MWMQYTGNDNSRLVWDEAYTKQQIEAKLGTSYEYESYYDDEVYDATVETYDFDSVFIELVGGKLNQFSVGGRRMEVHVGPLGMTVKKGESTQPFMSLPKEKAKVERFSEKIDGVQWFVPVQ